MRLRKLAGKYDSVTVPDYYEDRFKDKSHIIRVVAVIIIFLLMFTYVAGQLTAAGKSFKAIFGIDYVYGVLIGAVVTILYTIAGGYRAVAWTDLAQGLLMIFALVMMPIITIYHIGGVGPLMEKLRAQESSTFGTFMVEQEGKSHYFRVEDKSIYIFEDGKENVVFDKNFSGKGIFCKISREKDRWNGGYNFILEKISDSNIQIKVNKVLEERRNTIFLSKNDEIQIENGINIVFQKKFDLFGGDKLLSITGGRAGLGLLGFLIGMLGIGLGYPGCPHILTRFMSAENEEKLRRGRVIAMIWGTLALYGAIIMGISARVLLPDVIDPEYSLLEASKLLVHPVLAGLMLSAVVSAIRSTADSQILVAASAVARDIYQKTLSKDMTEKQMLLISRTVVFVLGVAAVFLAMGESRTVFWFILFTWSGLGSCFGSTLILSLYWKRLTGWGVVAGMVTGLVVTILWKLWLNNIFKAAAGFSLYEIVPAFFLASLAAVVVSLFTKAPDENMLEGL